MSNLPDFTKKEMEFIIENANFSDDEEKLFRMRCKHYTLYEIAEEIDVSYKTAYRINKRVKNKIIRII